MKTPVNWNDSIYTWNGSENFNWDDAYRVVQEVYYGGSDLTNHRKKISTETLEKFVDVVIKVNGLTQTYKKQKFEKPKITIDHIQKTFREFGFDKKISVKAEL